MNGYATDVAPNTACSPTAFGGSSKRFTPSCCLTCEQRQVIALKFIEGYDNGEIAALMDKKESAGRE